MKKQFLSVLAFTAILLSSCGGAAKIEKASACGQEGEITASSATAIAETESGKVAGYVENGIYIYKGIPYAKAERFMRPWQLTNGKASAVVVPTALLVRKASAWDGTATSRRLPSTGMTVIPMKTVCG